MLTGELQGATDHTAVMAPDREVPRSTEQGLEVLEVGAVDLRARTVRDVRGLFVRSLDKADPGLFLNQPIDVVGGPFQIRLHADSDSVVPFEEPLADPERVVGRMGVFHVQPENPAIRLRGIEDRDHLGQRVRLVDQHAKLRGLEADRSSDSSGRHGGQNLEVLPRRRLDQGLVPGFPHDIQNLTNSGLSRPQLWQRTRTSEVRAASRVLAVFPAVPATTPTSRKIHQRRMSHPPMPARTPPITNRMIAPMKVLKMLNTPPPPRAAPIVPVMKPKNA